MYEHTTKPTEFHTLSDIQMYLYTDISMSLSLPSLHTQTHTHPGIPRLQNNPHLLSSLSLRNVLHIYNNLPDNTLTSCQMPHTHTRARTHARTHTHTHTHTQKSSPVLLNYAKSLWQQLNLCHFCYPDILPCSHVSSHGAPAIKNLLQSFWLNMHRNQDHKDDRDVRRTASDLSAFASCQCRGEPQTAEWMNEQVCECVTCDIFFCVQHLKRVCDKFLTNLTHLCATSHYRRVQQPKAHKRKAFDYDRLNSYLFCAPPLSYPHISAGESCLLDLQEKSVCVCANTLTHWSETTPEG